jgi:hypothetical protein
MVSVNHVSYRKPCCYIELPFVTGYQRVAWTHNRDIYSVTKRQGHESSLDFALFHLIYIEFFIFGNQHLVWPEGLVGE